ncbi:hypothetical protein AK812_SmicGene20301 [Symbiodinium microadriaticum]|uniref:Uncharacterized protein n=1 Tax=Symbiodinium microadriaticum TaxID=2951 RepID=A0A1Q9DQC9_SYMMI|nr:hypothetical protein AK812_SmicGene20301 [Symbiodinium microadriaticum]
MPHARLCHIEHHDQGDDQDDHEQRDHRDEPSPRGACGVCGFLPTEAQAKEMIDQEDTALRLEKNMAGLFADGHWLRDRVARHLVSFYEFMDRSRKIQEQHHGPLDPIVSAAMGNVTDPQKPKHLEVAMIMDSLGNEFGKCTEYFTQKELPQQSVEVFERQHGPEHPQVATTLGFGKLGDYKEQKQALGEAPWPGASQAGQDVEQFDCLTRTEISDSIRSRKSSRFMASACLQLGDGGDLILRVAGFGVGPDHVEAPGSGHMKEVRIEGVRHGLLEEGKGPGERAKGDAGTEVTGVYSEAAEALWALFGADHEFYAAPAERPRKAETNSLQVAIRDKRDALRELCTANGRHSPKDVTNRAKPEETW